jgi:hypothetical protein
MSKLNVNTIEPSTGTTLSIGASGDTINTTDVTANNITINNTISTPARPSFSASRDTTDGSDIPIGYSQGYEVVHYNIGNHFNATNGTFTAPYAGTYHFMYQNIHNQISGDTCDISLELNPANFPSSAPTQINTGNPRTVIRVRRDIDEANWNTVGFSVPVYMNTGDFVVMYYFDGTTSNNQNYAGAAYWNNFSGYYVG